MKLQDVQKFVLKIVVDLILFKPMTVWFCNTATLIDIFTLIDTNFLCLWQH